MNIRVIGREALSKYPLLDGLFRRFVWSKVYFPENEMRFLHELSAGSIDIAIDLGAATGSYSWILNRVSNRVFAFEPGKIHNRYLKRVNFFTNIEVIQAAVGSTCANVSLYTPGSDNNALHSATVSKRNPVASLDETTVNQVSQISLDSFLEGLPIANRSIDLLKVDVEGYELEVFRGAVELLSIYHPLIICEIEARHNPRYTEVFSLLTGLEYSCYIYRSGEFEVFAGSSIEDFQKDTDLEVRLSENYDPESNFYINNFVFQHPQSNIKVAR